MQEFFGGFMFSPYFFKMYYFFLQLLDNWPLSAVLSASASEIAEKGSSEGATDAGLPRLVVGM